MDLFVGETLRFVQHLLRGGVPTELHLYAGAYHGFMRSSPAATLTQRAEQEFWGALERHFRPTS